MRHDDTLRRVLAVGIGLALVGCLDAVRSEDELYEEAVWNRDRDSGQRCNDDEKGAFLALNMVNKFAVNFVNCVKTPSDVPFCVENGVTFTETVLVADKAKIDSYTDVCTTCLELRLSACIHQVCSVPCVDKKAGAACTTCITEDCKDIEPHCFSKK